MNRTLAMVNFAAQLLGINWNYNTYFLSYSLVFCALAAHLEECTIQTNLCVKLRLLESTEILLCSAEQIHFKVGQKRSCIKTKNDEENWLNEKVFRAEHIENLKNQDARLEVNDLSQEAEWKTQEVVQNQEVEKGKATKIYSILESGKWKN